jgi:hypothetical protein
MHIINRYCLLCDSVWEVTGSQIRSCPRCRAELMEVPPSLVDRTVSEGDVFLISGWAFWILGISSDRNMICTESWKPGEPTRHVHRRLPLPASALQVQVIEGDDDD